MANDKKRHGYGVKRVMIDNQQAKQDKGYKYRNGEAGVFFHITQMLDGFLIEILALVNQR